jgi:hypothetical protein
MQAYEHHNARVRQGVSPNQLLELNLKEGWNPLRAFLEQTCSFLKLSAHQFFGRCGI